MWYRLCFAAALIATAPLLAKTSTLAELRPAIDLIRKEADAYRAIGTSGLAKNPLAGFEFSPYASQYYLLLYQGIGAFLVGKSKQANDRGGMREEMTKAQAAFSAAVAIAPKWNGEARSWLDDVNEFLAGEYFALGSHNAAMRLFDLIPAKKRSALLVPYARALLESGRKKELHQLALSDDTLFNQLKQLTAFADEMKTVDATRPALQLFGKGKPGPLQETPDATRAVQGGENAQTTEEQRAHIVISRILSRFFASENKREFQWIKERYLAVRKKQQEKGEVTPTDRALVHGVQKKLDVLPPDLLFTLAYDAWKEVLLDDAIAALKTLVKKYPYHSIVPEAYFNLGRLYEDKQLYPLAQKTMRTACARALGTSFEEQCEFRRAWISLLGKLKSAPTELQAYLSKYPEGIYASTAQYYLNRDKSNAEIMEFIRDNPVSYYALVLLREKNLPAALITDATTMKGKGLGELLKSSPTYRVGVDTQGVLRIYTELKELGLNEEAWTILNRYPLEPGNPLFSLALLKEYEDLQYLPGMTKLGLQAFTSIAHLRTALGWEMLYPQFKRETITRYLAEEKLDPNLFSLICGLIRQESAFDAKAQSPANAFGLMQLIPATASEMAKELGVGSVDPYDPEQNLRLGVHYVAELLRKYKSNIHFALAAYNAGPMNADRWITLRGNLGENEFIESIPFQETRVYVKLVLRNMRLYDLLYAGGPLRAAN